MSNAIILRNQGENEDVGVKETIMEINKMIINMETAVIKRMEAMEKKRYTIAKHR